MLGVFFTFDFRASSGEVLPVVVREPKLVTVNDTNLRLVQVEIRNPLNRAVSLTGFKTSLRGPKTSQVVVAFSDPSPFDIPARGMRVGHIELTALDVWPGRIQQTAITTARETPSSA